MAVWYYAKGVVKHGPKSRAEVDELITAGDITSDDLVWKSGMPAWQSVRSVAELLPASKPTEEVDRESRHEKGTGGHTSRSDRQASVAADLQSAVGKTKKVISHSVAAAQATLASPETQSRISRIRSRCRSLWLIILRFWIRLSAWYLCVLRKVSGRGKEPAETPQHVFPFKDVLTEEANVRAADVPKAVTVGKIVHGVMVFWVASAILTSIFDLGGGESMAKVMAEQFVREQLRSPSTADFPWTNEYDATEIEDEVWRVTGYVDAQNGFGATIRNRWEVTVKYAGDDKWVLLDCDIW